MNPSTKTHEHGGRSSDSDSDSGSEPVSRAAQAESLVTSYVRADPYGSLGVAVGVGFLVGGGMWKLVARSVLGLGTRVALNAFLASFMNRRALNPHKE